MRHTTAHGATVLFMAMGLLAGCAVVPEPVPTPTTPPPAPQPVPASVGTTASGGDIASRAAEPALIDSAPSPQALEVLATIPEPISDAQRVPPPEQVQRDYPPSPPLGNAAMSGAVLADSARAGRDSASADSARVDTSLIPVPPPTKPLGQRRRPVPVVPDSLMRAAMGDSGKTDSSSAARVVPAAAPVHPDSCWRVQVAAPEEAVRAADLRRAAESLLLLPMVIELEEGRYKVRTADCLNAVNANRLRVRADASGFEGAFRFKAKP